MPAHQPTAFIRAFALLLPIAMLQACGSPDSAEQQVRTAIAEMELAAEARDVGDLMAHVSPDYRDDAGRTRDEATRYARGFFVANQSIHLLTRIEEIEFPSTDEARVSLLIGMVGRDAETDSAWNLAADLFDLDLVLIREGDEWRVTYLSGQPADRPASY